MVRICPPEDALIEEAQSRTPGSLHRNRGAGRMSRASTGSVCGAFFLIVEHPQVALVADRGDHPLGDGALDAAVAFVSVRAVWKPAQRHEWPELDEVALHFFGNDVPQFHLPHAG